MYARFGTTSGEKESALRRPRAWPEARGRAVEAQTVGPSWAIGKPPGGACGNEYGRADPPRVVGTRRAAGGGTGRLRALATGLAAVTRANLPRDMQSAARAAQR